MPRIPPSAVHGTPPIRTLLIANRGEISRRVQATARSLGIRTVAVFTEVDRDLPHVREADRAVDIGPPQAYLSPHALLVAAEATEADAIHPGYGFLAENADFAEAVLDAGLIWVGPPPDAIRAMGDKSRARRIAVSHDVPVLPGFEEDDGTDEPLIAAAQHLGFPVLVKAAGGGGGRGMRRVERAEELPEALASARREAQAAFSNPTLLLERWLDDPRHIEVQVLADDHGAAVHLFERECSIQRRHQKIVEESPSPGVDDSLRERLGRAALTVTQAVGYQGAGTVEFLVDSQGDFYFLEMNTRLQVEHPVTELVTGQDLVALQLAVAEGRPLPLTQADVRLDGHAIEARLYAEDPHRDHLPATGQLLRFHLPAGDGVRVDAGYERGDVVGIHYDPLLAKIIAWGPDRGTATRRLLRATERAWVPGVVNNLPLLRQIFAHPAWERAELDTGFLGRTGLPGPVPLNMELGVVAGTVLAWWEQRGAFPHEVPLGWRVEGRAAAVERWRSGAEELEVRWVQVGPAELEVDVGGGVRRVQVLGRDGDRLHLVVDGVRATWRVAATTGAVQDGSVVYLHTGQEEAVVGLVPRFPPPRAADAEPGSCAAPMPGTVTAIHVEVGQEVDRGQALVTVEAMKVEHVLATPDPGAVEVIFVDVGQTVDEGDLLVRVRPEED